MNNKIKIQHNAIQHNFMIQHNEIMYSSFSEFVVASNEKK